MREDRHHHSEHPGNGSEKIDRNRLYEPIPIHIPSVVGWKEVPIRENGEPLVSLGPFAGNTYDGLFTSAIYYGERKDSPYRRGELTGSLLTAFVREEVAEQVLKADKLLPPGMHFIIFDTYRSLEVQGSLYEQYYNQLKQQHPDWSEEELSEETQKMVSLPSTDPDKPSPHNTGGSIDLAIFTLPPHIEDRVQELIRLIREADANNDWAMVYRCEMERIGLIAQHAEMLDFGTPFDYGGKEASINYYEKLEKERALSAVEQQARDNRRLLYNSMTAVGLEPYADEWWHYNSPKSQMGAQTAGLVCAEYGAAELSEENIAHEQLRRKHLRGSERLWGRVYSGSKLMRQVEVMRVAIEGVRLSGNLQKTSVSKAEAIAPPEES